MNKKDYRKIDIYMNGRYEASTTWSKTCKEAKANFCNTYDLHPTLNKITCNFAK